jgi:hypothetical protein
VARVKGDNCGDTETRLWLDTKWPVWKEPNREVVFCLSWSWTSTFAACGNGARPSSRTRRPPVGALKRAISSLHSCLLSMLPTGDYTGPDPTADTGLERQEGPSPYTTLQSTSSSSVFWWTTHAQSGGPQFAHTSTNCKCCNPSVLSLRLTQRSTLVTGKIVMIWGFHSSPPHQNVDCEIWLEVNRCGETLSSATWKPRVPTKGRLKSPPDNRGGLTLSRPVDTIPKKMDSNSS